MESNPFCGIEKNIGPIVYRLGHKLFKLGSRVRLPVGSSRSEEPKQANCFACAREEKEVSLSNEREAVVDVQAVFGSSHGGIEMKAPRSAVIDVRDRNGYRLS